MNLANYSESNGILSLRSYFQSNGGTFFETPGILYTVYYILYTLYTIYHIFYTIPGSQSNISRCHNIVNSLEVIEYLSHLLIYFYFRKLKVETKQLTKDEEMLDVDV